MCICSPSAVVRWRDRRIAGTSFRFSEKAGGRGTGWGAIIQDTWHLLWVTHVCGLETSYTCVHATHTWYEREKEGGRERERRREEGGEKGTDRWFYQDDIWMKSKYVKDFFNTNSLQENECKMVAAKWLQLTRLTIPSADKKWNNWNTHWFPVWKSIDCLEDRLEISYHVRPFFFFLNLKSKQLH